MGKYKLSSDSDNSVMCMVMSVMFNHVAVTQVLLLPHPGNTEFALGGVMLFWWHY